MGVANGPVRDGIAPGTFMLTPESYAALSVSDVVRTWTRAIPDKAAFISTDRVTTWREYDRMADAVSGALQQGEQKPESRAAVLLPDTAAVHAGLCGCFRAGWIATAIGARSGVREIAHVMRRTRCTVLITAPLIRERGWEDLIGELHSNGVVLTGVVVVDERSGAVDLHELSSVDLCGQVVSTCPDSKLPFTTSGVTILNSTSGTTGLPKVVAHTERKWVEFGREAMVGGHITGDDVFCSVVPAPFGFGLWSAHFLPTFLGIPTVVLPRFDVEEMARLIERERVTVLCCVSTQFKMLLRSPEASARDLSSLRVMYTGGESVPYDAALNFERRTGAKVLQFYGSNEAGAVSRTTLEDDVETRLRTCGHVLESMNVRVVDDEGSDVVGSPRRGQPAVRGPLLSGGYWEDDSANGELYTKDGWMMLGDVVEIDADGRVRVVGRKADIIIRGGKNISVIEIENLVRGFDAVADVAVVGIPDELFGERVCAVVMPADGHHVDTDVLAGWMRERGVTPEYLPEYVVTVDGLPVGAGGKVDRRATSVLAVEHLVGARGLAE